MNASTAENNDSSSSEYTTEHQTSKRKYHSAKSASGIISKFTLLTRQACKVCQNLADGVRTYHPHHRLQYGGR